MSRLIAKDGNALLRELTQGYFDRGAEQERRVEAVGADGVARREVRTASRRIETVVGEIEVKRLLYQAPGVAGLVPLAAALGLPDERYTHDLRKIGAEESATSSFDEVVELIEKRTGANVPKRQVEELAICAALDLPAFYRDRLCPFEETDHPLNLSFDGKGIATLHRDLREATRKAAEATPRRLAMRLVKGEKPNHKRMAEVTTVNARVVAAHHRRRAARAERQGREESTPLPADEQAHLGRASSNRINR